MANHDSEALEIDYDSLSVDEFFNKAVVKENGNYIIPEEIKEHLSPIKKELFTTEARRRHLQSVTEETRQRNLKLEAENKALKAFSKGVTISEEVQDELDILKYEDPDAWRIRMNELEQSNNDEYNSKFKEEFDKTYNQLTKAEKEKTLINSIESFNASRSASVSLDTIENYSNKALETRLNSGEITVDYYLSVISELSGQDVSPYNPEPSDAYSKDNTGTSVGNQNTSTSYEELYSQL